MLEWLTERLPAENVELGFFVDCGLSLNNPITITGITQAASFYFTAPGHGLVAGNFVDLRDIVSTSEIMMDDEGKVLPFKRYLVASVSGNNVYIKETDGTALPATGWTAYEGEGNMRKAVTTLSGLTHLEGKTVAILANGCEEPQQVVTSGSVTLGAPASIIHVGLPYTSEAKTLELTADAKEGNLQDKKRDVISLVVYVENTRALWVGPKVDLDEMEEIRFRDQENFDTPTELYTGTKEVTVAPGEGESASTIFYNDSPLPVALLAVIPKITYGTL